MGWVPSLGGGVCSVATLPVDRAEYPAGNDGLLVGGLLVSMVVLNVTVRAILSGACPERSGDFVFGESLVSRGVLSDVRPSAIADVDEDAMMSVCYTNNVIGRLLYLSELATRWREESRKCATKCIGAIVNDHTLPLLHAPRQSYCKYCNYLVAGLDGTSP